MKCLRRDPAERFETVRDLAEALSAAVCSGARARVASLQPDEIRGRTRSLATMRPTTASSRDLRESGDRTSTTFKILKPLGRLPGGVLAWAAAAVASMAIAAVFVVRARTGAAAMEPAPIVLYTAAGSGGAARAHRTLETTGAIPAGLASVRTGEAAATLADLPPRERSSTDGTASAAGSRNAAGAATPAPPHAGTPRRGGGRGGHAPKAPAAPGTMASRR